MNRSFDFVSDVLAQPEMRFITNGEQERCTPVLPTERFYMVEKDSRCIVLRSLAVDGAAFNFVCVTRLHITQDGGGFWMLSIEYPEGSMELVAYHFVTPEHLISDAQEMAAEDGDFPGALTLIDSPKAREAMPGNYRRPEPKRAGG